MAHMKEAPPMAHIKKSHIPHPPYGAHPLAGSGHPQSGHLQPNGYLSDGASSTQSLGWLDSPATTIGKPTPASSMYPTPATSLYPTPNTSLSALPILPDPEKQVKAAAPPTAVDGGAVAWLQCLGSFFLFFNSWGIVNSFGAFQTYYETTLLNTKTSSDIAWIGSLQACLIMFVGFLTGPVFDAGHMRPMLLAGSFLSVLGMFMTSLCTTGEYIPILLAQGLTVGLGLGCLLIPSVAILPTYFSKNKGLALGLAASGSSLGGILYPIMFHQIEPQVGYAWAVRLMAFIMLATLIIPVVVMKQRVQPSKARKLIDVEAWKEVPFLLFNIGQLFIFMGLYVPFFYVQLYALQKGVIDPYLSFYLVAILNTGSFLGRIIPNFIADKLGPLQVLASCGFISAILGFLWITVSSPVAILLFCFFYGLFSASFVSLPPVVVATMTKDPSTIGGRMGMLFIPSGIGLLAGTPVAGAIQNSLGWTGLVIFCGLSITISGVFVIAARVARVGWALNRIA